MDEVEIGTLAPKAPLPAKKSKLLPILIIVLIVLVLGVGGYYAYGKWGDQALVKLGLKEAAKTTATTETANTAVAIDETADWLTYTNTEVGFTFKYPQDWSAVKLNVINNLKNGVGGKFITSSDGKTGRVYFDAAKNFGFNAKAKAYVEGPPVYNTSFSKVAINPDWTKDELKAAMGFSDDVRILGVKKISPKSVFIATYTNTECSPGMSLVIATALNAEYPNFEISLDKFTKDSELAAEIESISLANGDKADGCDYLKTYQIITDNIIAGKYPNTQTDIKTAGLIANSLAADDTLAHTYINNQYNFSFVYPKGWVDKSSEFVKDPGQLKVAGYSDPEQDTKIAIGDCVTNEDANWVNKTPTKSSCTSKLVGLTAAQKESYRGIIMPKDLYVKIYDAKAYTDITKWYTDHYTAIGGQIGESYKVGKAISLDKINGVFINASCCAGYRVGYGVIKGNYVYEIGTSDRSSNLNDTDNSFLQQQVASFKFLDPTANWKTYRNTTEGYSVKYPADWVAEYSDGTPYVGATGDDGTMELYISPKKITKCDSACAPSPYSNALLISSGNSTETLEEAFNRSMSTWDKTSLTIGGQPAFKGVTTCVKNPGVGCDQPNWITLYKNKLYSFGSGLSYQSAYDAIISTLKFLN